MVANNIKYAFIFSFFLFFACKGKDKDTIQQQQKQEEVVKIRGKQYLNQTIYRNNKNEIDQKKSRYYVLKDNCLSYFTNIDTISYKLGKNRFIVYKTSNDILSDFSNVDKIKLDEHFFKNNTNICFKNKLMPRYGFIEDIIFLNTDKKMNGENAVRIITKYMYVDLQKDKQADFF